MASPRSTSCGAVHHAGEAGAVALRFAIDVVEGTCAIHREEDGGVERAIRAERRNASRVERREAGRGGSVVAGGVVVDVEPAAFREECGIRQRHCSFADEAAGFGERGLLEYEGDEAAPGDFVVEDDGLRRLAGLRLVQRAGEFVFTDDVLRELAVACQRAIAARPAACGRKPRCQPRRVCRARRL